MNGDAPSQSPGRMPGPTISQLGPYQLQRKLGEGAMAVVFLAEDTLLKRQVAVKILAPRLTKDAEFLARFRREAQAAGQLNHPNIAGAYAVGEQDGLHYYVMEYCEGETLDHKLKSQGRLEWYSAVEITRQVAEGLRYAHSQGFIHRDIKPANIILQSDGVAKILDLGLSKNTQGGAENAFQTMGAVTVGTPHYISPEQGRGRKDIDGRADIYSLGATLYHLVTGATLFKGETTAAIVVRHVTDPLPNPLDLVPDLPGSLVRVMTKMMARNPEDRYADCGLLVRDLEAVQKGAMPVHAGMQTTRLNPALPRRPVGGTTHHTDRVVPVKSRRQTGAALPVRDPRIRMAVAGGVVGLMLLAVVAFSLMGNRSDPENVRKQRATQASNPIPAQKSYAPELPDAVAKPAVKTGSLAVPRVPADVKSVAPPPLPRKTEPLRPDDLPPRIVYPAKPEVPNPPPPKPSGAVQRSGPLETQTWAYRDIGSTGAAGTTRIEDDRFILQGAGKDIWETEDSFHFASVRVEGDAEIMARVVSLQNTDPWAKAGVMVRESLTDWSRHALMAVTPEQGLAFQRRLDAKDLSESTTSDPDAHAPHWVRLLRTGKWVSGYTSADGKLWNHVSTLVVPMDRAAFFGLAACSHVEGRTSTAEFGNVRVADRSGRSLPAGVQSADVGLVGVAGGAGCDDGVYTLAGSGQDIYETADGFRFVWVEKRGDFDLRARVASVAATHPWAKAGLMARASTDAGSVHVAVVASAANGYLFEHRGRADDVTATQEGGVTPFPSAWMRLTRQGGTLRAYRAADGAGKEFAPLGEPVALKTAGPLLVGLCVTSHQNSKLTLAEFHNVEGLVPDPDR